MNRSRTPDCTILFILNNDSSRGDDQEDDVETPKIAIPFSKYKAINIPNEQKIKKIRPVPSFWLQYKDE